MQYLFNKYGNKYLCAKEAGYGLSDVDAISRHSVSVVAQLPHILPFINAAKETFMTHFELNVTFIFSLICIYLETFQSPTSQYPTIHQPGAKETFMKHFDMYYIDLEIFQSPTSPYGSNNSSALIAHCL